MLERLVELAQREICLGEKYMSRLELRLIVGGVGYARAPYGTPLRRARRGSACPPPCRSGCKTASTRCRSMAITPQPCSVPWRTIRAGRSGRPIAREGEAPPHRRGVACGGRGGRGGRGHGGTHMRSQINLGPANRE